MSNKTAAKKPRGRDTLKKALERQKERLLPQMLALNAIVDQIEADWPCHRLHLVLQGIRRAVHDLLPVDTRGVPADYFTPDLWLRVFAPLVENGYVTESDLLREALALARPNGPENEDGVCEVLGSRRCETYFSVHILRLAYKNCPVTPFPDDDTQPKTDEAPKDQPSSRNQAQVLDLRRFREERGNRLGVAPRSHPR